MVEDNPMDEEIRGQILRLLDQHPIMTIATLRPDGWPQAPTVGYVDQRDVHQQRLAGGHGLGVEQSPLVREGRLGTLRPCCGPEGPHDRECCARPHSHHLNA